MPATGRTRGPYAKTAQVRERILDACVEAFSETGYRATTMKEIAERAGISERGLAHHFPNKADLLDAVLHRHQAEAAEALRGVVGAAEILVAMVDDIAEDTGKPGLVELRSILSAEAVAPDHPAHAHYRDRYDMLRAYTTSAFETLASEGELDAYMTPAELAASYIALSDGLQLQWLFNRSGVDAAQTLRRFLEANIPRLRDPGTAAVAQAGTDQRSAH
ncbi:MAG: helix-turn-helix domain-containing protein [Microbacterium sp.]